MVLCSLYFNDMFSNFTSNALAKITLNLSQTLKRAIERPRSRAVTRPCRDMTTLADSINAYKYAVRTSNKCVSHHTSQNFTTKYNKAYTPALAYIPPVSKTTILTLIYLM